MKKNNFTPVELINTVYNAASGTQTIITAAAGEIMASILNTFGCTGIRKDNPEFGHYCNLLHLSPCDVYRLWICPGADSRIVFVTPADRATYDVFLAKGLAADPLGLSLPYPEAVDYIKHNNGTDAFDAYYTGGTANVVCNQQFREALEPTEFLYTEELH